MLEIALHLQSSQVENKNLFYLEKKMKRKKIQKSIEENIKLE